MDTDAHPIYDENKEQINKDKPIHIGNKVWIGCRRLILKSTEIPDNCVVGANSFLNKKYEKVNTIIAGNPGKVVKGNIEW